MTNDIVDDKRTINSALYGIRRIIRFRHLCDRFTEQEQDFLRNLTWRLSSMAMELDNNGTGQGFGMEPSGTQDC